MAGLERNHNRKFDKRILIPIVLVCAALVAGGIAGMQAYRRRQVQNMLEQLAEDTRAHTLGQGDKADAAPLQGAGEDPYQALADMGVPIPDKEVDFAALQEGTNADIYAWIYIPDTRIDYPVLQHPTDNTYYLNYNIDGSRGYPGCIYTEDYNGKDFSDPNTVVYGHNMKDGSMFAGLHKFEDSEYFEGHPYIYVYTEDGLLVYEIFSARESGDEHILMTYFFENKRVYRQYLEEIFDTRSMNCNIREGVEVTPEDRILTLSTCISNKPNNRYLVQGVLLNED